MCYIVNYGEKLLDNLKKAYIVAIDTETKSLEDKTMVGFSVAYEDKEFYVPVIDKYLDLMPVTKAKNLLNYILKNCHVVFHNSSFDIPVLYFFGAEFPDNFECDDTVIMANLIDENMMHGLKKLAKAIYDVDMIEIKEVCGTGKNRKSFDEAKSDIKVEYACADAKMTLRIYKVLSERLKNDQFSKNVYETIEKPLLNVVAKMHIHGININIQEVKNIAKICQEKIELAEKKLRLIMGQDINFNSSKQLKVYFVDLKHLPVVEKSELTGQPSMSKDVLEKYAEINNEAKLLLEFRKYSKIYSTFIPALTPQKWDSDTMTGRIFAAFNQAGTVSGRFSSSRPNMQNIPRKDEKEDFNIREAIIPDEGHILIGADYSQIELRILAHFSQDANLLRAYNENKDIHQQTADALNIPRQQAKTINFGLVYGMRNRTLAKQIGVSDDMAQQYIDKYFQVYSGIANFWKQTEEQFKNKGYVQTISGRKRRRSRHFYHKDDYEQGAEIRSATNSIIQGSGADLIKMAMILMSKEFKQYDAHLILTVHDEVLVSCPREHYDYVHDIIKNSMLEASKLLSVPVDVDVRYGETWAEAHSGNQERIIDLLKKSRNPKKINSKKERDKINA